MLPNKLVKNETYQVRFGLTEYTGVYKNGDDDVENLNDATYRFEFKDFGLVTLTRREVIDRVHR